MKALKILSSLLLVGAVVLTSCEDDEETTTQKLQRYWAVDSVAIKSTTGGGSTTVVYNGTASDYYDFRTDGNLHFKLNTAEDVLPYSILSDSWLKVDGDSVKINLLTNNKLLLYKKDETNPTEYVETFGYFRR